MSKQKASPQAIRICGLTLLCLVIMFGVAAANKAKGGESLVAEYTIEDENLPRHVKFESMPSDLAQLQAAWFYKYQGLGQYELCGKLFPEDQLQSLNLDQQDRDLKEGYYMEEYIIHGFETLSQETYQGARERYDKLASSYGYKEYKVVRVSFTQKWSPKALARGPQWGDGTYTRDLAVGKEPGRGEKWKIFDLGMM